VIEGRVANFGQLIVEHAEIVGRRFAIDYAQRFIAEHDRGLLVIEAEPGKGKTALMAHLIEHVFDHFSPSPVHFFYRRTAGFTNPDVCVKSLYASLLEVHDITEADESKQRSSPEETYNKLVNLLAEQIAPRLSPQRPQLILVDALDEAKPNRRRQASRRSSACRRTCRWGCTSSPLRGRSWIGPRWPVARICTGTIWTIRSCCRRT
jgi:hypothetical protein